MLQAVWNTKNKARRRNWLHNYNTWRAALFIAHGQVVKPSFLGHSYRPAGWAPLSCGKCIPLSEGTPASPTGAPSNNQKLFRIVPSGVEQGVRGGLGLVFWGLGLVLGFFFFFGAARISRRGGRRLRLVTVLPHGGKRTRRCRQGAPQCCAAGIAMADYEAVQRGPLRLKGSGGALGAGKRWGDGGETAGGDTRRDGRTWGQRGGQRWPPSARRKKKKAKDKAQILEQIVSSKKQEEEKKRGLDKRTPAQVAYEKMQEKRVRAALPGQTLSGGSGGGVKTPRGAASAGSNRPLLCLPPANGEDPEESV